MILQYENMLFWKRNYGEPKHLFWITNLKSEPKNWVSQVDHIKDAIGGVLDDVKKMITGLDKELKMNQLKQNKERKVIQNKFNEAKKR
jgi:hypothetical protein